ncbi:MAG TPA: hypothetical protein VL283_01405 [Candidatus Baltobacteraceae bacterium]|nr:hypothetical protein [Candidatus Baltobacteraceae bacterium]
MDRIEDLLDCACEDQREALLKFRETGCWDDAARVHYESCLACDRALERLIGLRVGSTPAPHRNMPKRSAALILLALCVACLGAVGALGYVFLHPFFDDRPATEAERMQSRIRYVRMPGHPDVCVATLPGAGGYGPTFIGAARCTRVHDRVEFDEGATYDLAAYAIAPIEGTSECLAYHEDASFAFPCAPDDD